MSLKEKLKNVGSRIKRPLIYTGIVGTVIASSIGAGYLTNKYLDEITEAVESGIYSIYSPLIEEENESLENLIEEDIIEKAIGENNSENITEITPSVNNKQNDTPIDHSNNLSEREIRGKILAELQDSTYCIKTISRYEDGNISVAFGTGFAYRNEEGHIYLLTNRHVASQPDIPTYYGIIKKVSEVNYLVDDIYDTNIFDDIPLEVVTLQSFKDTAVLKTREKEALPVATNYKIIPRDMELYIGDEVYLLGYPLANSNQVAHGTISNIDKENYFYLNSTVAPGNSGGFVFLKDNNEFYLIGQLGVCIPNGAGGCLSYGGFKFADEEMQRIWNIK